MIRSLAKLSTVLEPDEQYVWHAPLVTGGAGSNSPGMTVFVLGLIAIILTAFSFLRHGDVIVGTIVLCSLAYLIGEYMISPYELLIITNKRALHMTRKMRLMRSFEFDAIGVEPGAGTAVVTARAGDTTIKWLCACNLKHAQHLTRHIEQKGPDSNLLSS
jgi:hypothetical protein